ncbi:isoprenylcysteine carboxylmethyltransferase family protein [Synechococcales cyanobacterium C]|uniref:methanethiol S-methyltransferase n=1 Tax=Petrachloros mirabilis ULC683 TaxID=2781853 RepID=A0A8K2A7G5_9CYAN|nr:methanethiol S-methyltransferase [Petrachloros mirabilis]NCJ06174.1 isoprenylcysteine carboxylmethyltransferase family protein [Petrachloros mirabilis ULC683]
METQVPQIENKNKVTRVAAFIYGLVCYVIFFATFLYTIGFVGNLVVPKSIDSEPIIPLGQAILVNVVLLGIFGLQHSGMARQGFKKWWTQIVPKSIERSTYVLFSSLCLITLFYFWQPLGMTVWNLENPLAREILFSLFGVGWLLVLVSTFLINHFDLFGLRQVYLHLQGKEYTPLPFATPALYNYVRHPLYVGFLIAFWAAPTMTIAHLLFAIITTVYILLAIQLEERDLVSIHGQAYADYRRRVPMLIPFGRR